MICLDGNEWAYAHLYNSTGGCGWVGDTVFGGVGCEVFGFARVFCGILIA